MANGPDLFRQEYERINRDVYDGRLPGFPGVELVDRRDVFSMTQARASPDGTVLRPFLLSKHVTGELLLESIRHEVAHAAAILFDGDHGHGPAWRVHAGRVGALSLATLDPEHPLRREW